MWGRYPDIISVGFGIHHFASTLTYVIHSRYCKRTHVGLSIQIVLAKARRNHPPPAPSPVAVAGTQHSNPVLASTPSRLPAITITRSLYCGMLHCLLMPPRDITHFRNYFSSKRTYFNLVIAAVEKLLIQ
jgi:hypothetical protein